MIPKAINDTTRLRLMPFNENDRFTQFCSSTFTEEELTFAKKYGLALFDFDGTITIKDSFELFILNLCGGRSGLVKDLLRGPKLLTMLLGFYLNIVPSATITELFMMKYFKGHSISGFQAMVMKYLPILKTIIKPEALERIDWHRKQKHLIIVVSATPKILLKPWCEMMRLKVIGSELKIEKNVITGKFDGLECNGQQKVLAIEERIGPIKEFPYVYAYGNSKDDLPMLMLASKNSRFFNRLI